MTALELDNQREMLTSYAKKWCSSRDEQCELVNTTILKAWMARDNFTSGTNMKNWLLTIARNQFYDNYRRKRSARTKTHPLSDVVMKGGEAVDLGASPDRGIDLKRLEEQLNNLPGEVGDALRLWAKGKNVRQIADIQGTSIHTTTARIRYARIKLARIFQAMGYDTRRVAHFANGAKRKKKFNLS